MAHFLINSGLGVKRSLHIRQPTAANSLKPPYRATGLELRPSAARMARLVRSHVRVCKTNPETPRLCYVRVCKYKP